MQQLRREVKQIDGMVRHGRLPTLGSGQHTSRDTKHNSGYTKSYTFALLFICILQQSVTYQTAPKQFSPHSLMNSFHSNAASSRSLGNPAPSQTLISNPNLKKTATLSALKTLLDHSLPQLSTQLHHCYKHPRSPPTRQIGTSRKIRRTHGNPKETKNYATLA